MHLGISLYTILYATCVYVYIYLYIYMRTQARAYISAYIQVYTGIYIVLYVYKRYIYICVRAHDLTHYSVIRCVSEHGVALLCCMAMLRASAHPLKAPLRARPLLAR